MFAAPVNYFQIWLFELNLFIVFLLLFSLYPHLSLKLYDLTASAIKKISKNYLLSTLTIGLIALIGSMMVAIFVQFPTPSVHDEFSYLLAADTFSSMRLTNPPHPMKAFFETFHVLQSPTYASKYPPGQGFLLALGQMAGGRPVVGLWIGAALTSIAIYWMLRAWTPAPWAVVGGLVAALNLGCFGYWVQKYWGGFVAAIGGALLYGALRRIVDKPTTGRAVWLAVGLFLLANSRPLEGLLFSLPACFIMGKETMQAKGSSGRWAKDVVFPIILVVAIGFAWMGFYNQRVTGNPFVMPYQKYSETFRTVPIFLWQTLNPSPDCPISVFNEYKERQINRFNSLRRPMGFLKIKSIEFIRVLIFYFRFVFLITLPALFYLRKDLWITTAFLAIGLVVLTAAMEYQTTPRKIAPATCFIVFMIISGMRFIRSGSVFKIKTGKIVLVSVFLSMLFSISASFLDTFHLSWGRINFRHDLVEKLRSTEGSHLIFVRYEPDHDPHIEYVYNKADIDNAKVVWAHDLGQEENKKLIDYFKNRKIWLIEESEKWDENRVEEALMPYDASI